MTSTPANVFSIGEVLNGVYEIKGILGSGGMGQVFEAHDRALNRRVAIKAHWTHIEPDTVRKEAQALSAIRHPGMVTVYTVGVHRAVHYVVMERVYGVSLDAHLARLNETKQRFALGEAIDILASIAEGLAAVHRAGVAHRDVKPSNVMLAPGNRVVLMDFGIFLPEIDDAIRTAGSGSPDYMAPETINHSIEPGAGYLVDVYAFGVIAFEILTGKVPFQGATPFAIFDQHLRARAPDLTRVRSDVPPRLARLIDELLAKDPRERPQSMETVAYRLRALRSPSDLRDDDEFDVVIADDDSAMASTLEAIVTEVAPDARIRTAFDGEQAIELVRQKPPKLMLLDLQMPGVNGLEVCMYLRGTRLAEGCTIVSVSAGAQEQDVQLLNLLGITRFVRKGPDLVDRLMPIIDDVRRA